MTQKKVGSLSESREPDPQSREPVAWAAWFDGEIKPNGDFTFSTFHNAEGWCLPRGARPAPLYRQPTLTDEEREAIQTAAMLYEQGAQQMGHVEDGKRAVALRAMLERLK